MKYTRNTFIKTANSPLYSRLWHVPLQAQFNKELNNRIVVMKQLSQTCKRQQTEVQLRALA